MNFDQAFAKLLDHEGGYSDHKADPGGKTMLGITEAVARQHGYTGDMRNLPLAFAKSIYRRMYWDAVKADDLPDAVRFDVFDAAVNSGVHQAALWLQRAAGVEADGQIGPVTLAACRFMGASIKPKFTGHRLAFMASLPSWPNFGRGWARRIASNLQL